MFDVGQALSVVIILPDSTFIVYDVGGGGTTVDSLHSIIPDDKEIEMLVLSHTDSDHINGVEELFEAYTVNKVIRSGMTRTSGAWEHADSVITQRSESVLCEDIRLDSVSLLYGFKYD